MDANWVQDLDQLHMSTKIVKKPAKDTIDGIGNNSYHIQ